MAAIPTTRPAGPCAGAAKPRARRFRGSLDLFAVSSTLRSGLVVANQEHGRMKKLGGLLGFMTVALWVSAAHAQAYGMAGCGLGSLLFGKDNSKGMQILAATTNGIF